MSVSWRMNYGFTKSFEALLKMISSASPKILSLPAEELRKLFVDRKLMAKGAPKDQHEEIRFFGDHLRKVFSKPDRNCLLDNFRIGIDKL
jgi:hypothetical protein